MPKVIRHSGGTVRRRKTSTKKSGGVLDRIYDSVNDVPDEGIVINLYGRSKTGKTRLMSTFPKPILHMVCSGIGMGETLSIRHVSGISPVEIQEPDDVSQLVEMASDGKFATVCLDHVTEFSNLILAGILGVEKLPEQNSWGMAMMKQYQQRGLQLKTYLKELMGLKSSNTNVVIIAQEKLFMPKEDEEGNSMIGGDVITPSINSDLGESVVRWLNYSADYICQTCIRPEVKQIEKSVGKGTAKKTTIREVSTGNYEYCLRIGPSDIYATGFRTSSNITELPHFVVNPTYEKLKQLM